ncbi:O-fucosyltransferase 36-like [Malania oleifera]|uniref:O-fucosyltransferase 36-like n=1 Tax=Malania oleifera TaxID=397392 RepID=UPI0025AEA271|nr:O-fucosyltransferase 36-like [Malania oleifera]XP_057979957.1 O-fucosyltransferase 36-like [Malania oleifera]XP_057979958.1 O-fucosyltransferase 36-like [Malania oleifera]
MERESISSSDEEEDRQNLIDQNDTKLPIHRSAFDIDDFGAGIARRFSFWSGLNFGFNYRRYLLLAICIPLLIVVLYFSLDIGSLFRSDGVWSVDSVGSRMRESELQALYLLRQQQLGLFSLWNRTTVVDNLASFHSNSSSVIPPVNSTSNNPNSSSALGRQDLPLLEDIKAALLKQISLNKQIEQALLSSHRSGNSSQLADEYVKSGLAAPYGYNRCPKVNDKFSERRTVEWKPKSNKFLFAICLSGQMSNHLICLEKHMFFAALLDRILVIPSSKVDYQYNRVLDIDHINKCLGRQVVMPFEEFSETRKNHVHIDRFLCYFSSPAPCFVDEEHVKKLKSLGISMGKLHSVWNEDTKKPSKRTVEDVRSKFSSNDDVIAIGDVFFADVEREWVMQPGGPLAHKCRTLIEPSRLIMLTAQRFIQTFLGNNFIALHFRRHGFLKFCNAKSPSCFFPIPQAADCISQVVERANTPVIYLSTDAAESETNLLQSLIMLKGKYVPLVKRPARNSAEKWDALLYRHGLEQDSQVEAMLDKTICAMSSVFIGSSGSTFTEDILRLRKDWGWASLCDEYICQGELPNFIAGNE